MPALARRRATSRPTGPAPTLENTLEMREMACRVQNTCHNDIICLMNIVLDLAGAIGNGDIDTIRKGLDVDGHILSYDGFGTLLVRDNNVQLEDTIQGRNQEMLHCSSWNPPRSNIHPAGNEPTPSIKAIFEWSCGAGMILSSIAELSNCRSWGNLL
jgi:hypothetical protein